MREILNRIGLPALLEQTAEECSELAQACLKYARLLRQENPTPKTEQECVCELMEDLLYQIKDVLDVRTGSNWYCGSAERGESE